MKKDKKENKFISSDRKALSAKRNAHGALTLVASLLALALIVGGSIFSFAMVIKDSQKSDDNGSSGSDGTSAYVPKSAEISDEKMKILDDFDTKIEEIDKNIKELDAQIEECGLSASPEKRVYAKELYDKRAGILLSKSILCKQYSDTCLEWAQETRDLLAEPIAEYEEYCEIYKERLSVAYETGFPDFSEIFGTSETIMDFVMGKVLLDEIRSYDRELADKVSELYAVVEDGLAVVKYYLARSDNYSNLQNESEEEFYACSSDASKYLSEISLDKDVYNYLLQYYAERDQIFAKQLRDAASQNTGAADVEAEYSYPVGSEFFYTDYIGNGHGSRVQWSSALGKYVNVFHSGVDIHTALRYADVKASADGRVVYADYCPARGYTVALLHTDGVITVYSGCSLVKVELGSEVKEGDVVALSGISGESDEFKVTFEVFSDGEFVDPKNYIELPDVSLSDN